MFALGFLAGAVICGTALFFVGLTIGDAPTIKPTYLDDREGAAAGPPPTSGRGSLRAVEGDGPRSAVRSARRDPCATRLPRAPRDPGAPLDGPPAA